MLSTIKRIIPKSIKSKFYWKKDYKKFIVLTRSRTGSSMLMDLIGSHPAIFSLGEKFWRLDGQTVDEKLNQIFCPYPRSIKAIGFKIFYYHPVDDTTGLVWEKLLQIKDLYIIHLKRRNVLRTLTSKKIAMSSDVWNLKNERNRIALEDKKVHFNVDELREGFQETRNWEDQFDRMFMNHKTLDIYYEEIINDPNFEIRRIMNFLGMPEITAFTNFTKQNPEKLSDLIINYSDLENAFSNTKWSNFFDDEKL